MSMHYAAAYAVDQRTGREKNLFAAGVPGSSRKPMLTNAGNAT